MYSHKLPNHFKVLKPWYQFRSLFVKKHTGKEGFRFQNVDAKCLLSHTQPEGVVFENKKQPENHQPVAVNETDSKKWRKNWKSFITTDVKSFTTDVNKGICNIDLNLSNKTAADIDYVQLRVLYLEENGNLYKSEYAEVFGVKPMSNIKVPVYDSPKGSSLQVYISQVVARAFNFEFSQDSYA